METDSITPFHKQYKKHAHNDEGRVSMLRQVWSDIEKDLLGGQKMQGTYLTSFALEYSIIIKITILPVESFSLIFFIKNNLIVF